MLRQASQSSLLHQKAQNNSPQKQPATVLQFCLHRGLDIPVTGQPVQEIHDAEPVNTVALAGPDYVGLRPSMQVQVGDHVKLGQTLFTDKKTPGVKYTSPGCGHVVAINRGLKRSLLSVVIEITGDGYEAYRSYGAADIDSLDAARLREQLVDSGLWTALRTRPFSKTPRPDSTPHSIFVTAVDTHPLAARPEIVLSDRQDDFEAGLRVLKRLGAETLFLCKPSSVAIPGEDLPGLTVAEFSGPHPAGLPGTHIHLLDPAGRNKTVWHIGYQDVAAMGHLFLHGRPDPQRVVSLAGPGAARPRLLRTRLGANISELVRGEMLDGRQRVISGSLLAGRTAADPLDFLGRYHNQISLLPAAVKREFFGWLMPGLDKYAFKRVNLSCLLPRRRFSFNTSLYGGHRAIVPIGSYEKVMPLDIMPTFLLRALAVDDLEEAEALGCLELDEEDLALCTFVCPGKSEFGSMLRRNLNTIEKEG